MLEQRRIQQDKTLVQALQQEKERNLVRTRMVAMVTHDFRTPLTVIASCNSLLRDYAEGLTQERRILQQNRIEASVRKLLYMLDDMMIVAQSENGTLPFDPSTFTVGELIQTMVDEFQFIYAESHRIIFENTYGGNVYADNNLIRHITANLISNAVKYSPKGSTVNVTLSLSPDNETYWMLQVQDCGIGISEVDQAQLFTPFYRGQNVGKIKGTGLGLMIVKQAVEKHGGSIHVESKLNEGSTFTVTIPLISKTEPTAVVSDL
jgi:signal transduction histidine kinase